LESLANQRAAVLRTRRADEVAVLQVLQEDVPDSDSE
jgi:hypothetical protein